MQPRKLKRIHHGRATIVMDDAAFRNDELHAMLASIVVLKAKKKVSELIKIEL